MTPIIASTLAMTFVPIPCGEIVPYPTVVSVCTLKKNAFSKVSTRVEASAPARFLIPAAEYRPANAAFRTTKAARTSPMKEGQESESRNW